MKNKLFITSLVAISMLAFTATPTLAEEESMHEDFTEAKNLIDQKVSCDKLSDEQLEKIGDYYMEQVHPGEAHEQMDEMMGGEDSDSLTQMHILMARHWYCQDSIGMGMMGYLDGNANYNGGMMGMMGGNWNNNQAYNRTNGNYYPGNMMGYNWSSYGTNGGITPALQAILYAFSIIFFGVGIAAIVKYLMKK